MDQNVINRLRASKAAADEELRPRGHEDGIAWAHHLAEAAELETLARIDLDDASVFQVDKSCQYSPGECFLRLILGAGEFSREEAEEFWSSAAGEQSGELALSSAYVQSFAKAAVGVWNAVKDEL